MKHDLLNKEVLCILDTRQIQRYMFRSNSYLDTLGGSDLMTHILNDAIMYALSSVGLREDQYNISMDPDDKEIPYFTSDRILFQLIIAAAGNALCIVRTGSLCRSIIRKVSRYYLEHAYSLNLAAAVTEKTDHLGTDIFHLYQNLNRTKASCEISDPMGALSIVIREKNTGDPAIGVDAAGEYYGTASAIRRAEALKRKNLVEMKDMKATLASDGKKYLALIHVDGNNIGIMIGKILQDSNSYECGVRFRRRINRNITITMKEALDKTLSQMKDTLKSEEFEHVFQVIHQAGDDINCICSADLALPFLDLLYKNMEGAVLWKTEEVTLPLYICAGVAFVTQDADFHASYKLAEECCKSAKTEAKKEYNLIDGMAGNWIDFQICKEGYSQELDMLREHSYLTSDGVSLLLRPYSIGLKGRDKTNSYYDLLVLMKKLKELDLSRQQKLMMNQSYTMGLMEFSNWIQSEKKAGLDLVGILGQPLCRDENRQPRATWFDAVDLLNIIDGAG